MVKIHGRRRENRDQEGHPRSPSQEHHDGLAGNRDHWGPKDHPEGGTGQTVVPEGGVCRHYKHCGSPFPARWPGMFFSDIGFRFSLSISPLSQRKTHMQLPSRTTPDPRVHLASN